MSTEREDEGDELPLVASRLSKKEPMPRGLAPKPPPRFSCRGSRSEAEADGDEGRKGADTRWRRLSERRLRAPLKHAAAVHDVVDAEAADDDARAEMVLRSPRAGRAAEAAVGAQARATIALIPRFGVRRKRIK